MKKCKFCKSEIDSEAEICPICKKTQDIFSFRRLFKGFILALGIIVVSIIAFFAVLAVIDVVRENNELNSAIESSVEMTEEQVKKTDKLIETYKEKDYIEKN